MSRMRASIPCQRSHMGRVAYVLIGNGLRMLCIGQRLLTPCSLGCDIRCRALGLSLLPSLILFNTVVVDRCDVVSCEQILCLVSRGAILGGI